MKGFKDYGNYIMLECHDTCNNETINITCKYLVSTEGSRSVIREKLDPDFEKGIKWFVAYQNYYEGTSDLDPILFGTMFEG